jgi:hypothetical protein
MGNEHDLILIRRVSDILAMLLETETKKEYKNFLSGLKRNVSLYYDRAEAKGFLSLMGELIKKSLPRPDSKTLSTIS